MKMPWQDRTGLARATAIFATVFGIALGLCGLNAAAFFSIHSAAGNPLVLTAFIELFVMLASGVGLLVIALIAIYRTLSQRFFPSTDEDHK
jgi:hypothetical protein